MMRSAGGLARGKSGCVNILNRFNHREHRGHREKEKNILATDFTDGHGLLQSKK
jgi:hypothetical protein